MDFSIKASDWQVSLVATVGAGFVVAAGAYFMTFYSPTVSADTSARFRFYGIGFGAGGNLGGWSLPGILPDSWTSIPCTRPFCIWELNGATGAIGNAGVGVAINVGQTNMMATIGPDTLFDFDGDIGLSGAFGAGFSGLQGTYGLKGESNYIPQPDPTAWA